MGIILGISQQLHYSFGLAFSYSMKINILSLSFLIACVPVSVFAENVDPSGPYQPTCQSLEQYKVPEWYRDAKFGIFLHWSINSLVPEANDGWYGRQMYMQKGAPWGTAYEYHNKTFGHPSKFGYKDLIPLWKAENFRPDELVALFKQAGARYVVPVACHHDNFDNYASTYQPWNSVNMGPKKDIVGLWRDAILKAGLHFGVSSHSDRSWGWFETSHGSDTEGPLKDVPYDGDLTKADGAGKWWDGYDPQDLYSPSMKLRNDPAQAKALTDAYAQKWFLRTRELVEKYQPDLLYFDGWLPMGDKGLEVTSILYNCRMKEAGTDAVLNIKWNPDRKMCVEDLEKGLSNWIRPNVWQIDASINQNWFIDNLPLALNTDQIIHALVDTVSKNGNFLLNVALHADGTPVDEEKKRLLGVGEWLAVNGEAIYGTRPTHVFGEGPTIIKNWQGVDKSVPPFTTQDIRFTRKDDTLYAIFMGSPKDVAVIGALAKDSAIFSGAISSVRILGCNQQVRWFQDNLGLHIAMPSTPLSPYGFTAKITGLHELERDGVVRPQPDRSILLNCWDAQITGSHLAPQDYEPALTDWDHSDEYPTWTFICPKAGTFDLNVSYSSNNDGAEATVSVADQTFNWKIDKTKSDKDFKQVCVGNVTFPSAGKYTLEVRPKSPGWAAVNLSYVQIKSPVIGCSPDGSLQLSVNSATLHGDHFFLQNQGGRNDIGGWNDSADTLSWDKVGIQRPGKYEVWIEASAADGDTSLTVSTPQGDAKAVIPKTVDWDTFQMVSLGQIEFKDPAVIAISAGPTAGASWKPLNLTQVILKPVQ